MTSYVAFLVATNLVRCICPCGFCTESNSVPEHVNRIGYDLKLEVVTNQIPVLKHETMAQEEDEYEYAAMLITTNLVQQQCKCGFCHDGIVILEHMNQVGYDLRVEVVTNYLPIVRRRIKNKTPVKIEYNKNSDPTAIAVEEMLKELEEMEQKELGASMENNQ